MTKHRLTVVLVNLCRLAVGLVFLVSGLTKVVDPSGMGHKLMAYFHEWDVCTWMEGTAWITALVIALATVEFMLGTWLILGIRRRLTTMVTALLTAAFTLFTIYIYATDPVPDCGCFGDAVKLTHGQTLLKNVLLLALCVPLVLQPLDIKRLIRRGSQWIASLFAATFVIACGIYSSHLTPLVDFTSYVPGYSFQAAMEGVYGEEAQADAFNFAITKGEEDVTSEVLFDTTYTFLAVSPILHFVDHSCSDYLSDLHRHASDLGARFYFLTASDSTDIAQWVDATDATYAFYHTDEGVLNAAAKSNPALLLLHGDTIVGKWTKQTFPSLHDAQGNYVKARAWTQNPQNIQQKLAKVAAFFVFPLFFIIFADAMVASTGWLHRRRLRQMARSKQNS